MVHFVIVLLRALVLVDCVLNGSSTPTVELVSLGYFRYVNMVCSVQSAKIDNIVFVDLGARRCATPKSMFLGSSYYINVVRVVESAEIAKIDMFDSECTTVRNIENTVFGVILLDICGARRSKCENHENLFCRFWVRNAAQLRKHRFWGHSYM